jgi:hypothetical protein
MRSSFLVGRVRASTITAHDDDSPNQLDEAGANTREQLGVTGRADAGQTARVRVIACSGAGFLLAVLWFDLMFDIQIRGNAPDRDLPEAVRASIAGYYARVTTAARPMNRLIALVMVVTIAATAAELLRGDLAIWRALPAFVLTVVAVGIAALRTVRNAMRLGRQTDDATQQSQLARSILCDHLVSLGAIAVVIVLQLLPV